VPFSVWDRSEASAELSAAYAAEDPTQYLQYETALVMLNLAEPGALTTMARVDEMVENVPAFYDSWEQRIVIIDHGRASDPAYASLTLVHEYIHALQDAEFGLNSLHDAYVDSDDSYLALRALTEGEATFYETRVAAPMLGLDIAKLDLNQPLEEQRHVLEQIALEDPSPFSVSDFTFPYAFGPLLVRDAWLRGGTEAVRELYSDPPTTTQELLARGWGGDPFDQPFVAFEFPPVPDTHADEGVAVLGAWLVYLYLTSAAVAPEHARQVALATRGDALGVYSDSSTAAISLLWQLEFADPAQAELFGQQARTSAADSELDHQDTRVTLRASEATLPDWLYPPAAP
jgi:hypothetical protein